MPSRRDLLASTAGLAIPVLAGCSSTINEETTRHYVDMMNGSEEPHTFTVTATDERGETLFEREYDLGARSAEENEIMRGTPAQVTVVIDGTERAQFPWAPMESPDFAATHPDGCSEATSTGVSIWYGTQTADPITATYYCATVRDPS